MKATFLHSSMDNSSRLSHLDNTVCFPLQKRACGAWSRNLIQEETSLIYILVYKASDKTLNIALNALLTFPAEMLFFFSCANTRQISMECQLTAKHLLFTTYPSTDETKFCFPSHFGNYCISNSCTVSF